HFVLDVIALLRRHALPHPRAVFQVAALLRRKLFELLFALREIAFLLRIKVLVTPLRRPILVGIGPRRIRPRRLPAARRTILIIVWPRRIQTVLRTVIAWPF